MSSNLKINLTGDHDQGLRRNCAERLAVLVRNRQRERRCFEWVTEGAGDLFFWEGVKGHPRMLDWVEDPWTHSRKEVRWWRPDDRLVEAREGQIDC